MFITWAPAHNKESDLVKEVTGVCESLPHVVVEGPAEVAGVREVHEALRLTVKEVLEPGHGHRPNVVAKVFQP